MSKRIVLTFFVMFALTLVGCTYSASTPPAGLEMTQESRAATRAVEITETEVSTNTPTATAEPLPTKISTSIPVSTATPQIEGIPESEVFTEALYWFYNNGFVEMIDQEPQFNNNEITISRAEMANMLCKQVYQDMELEKATGTFTDKGLDEFPELSSCLEQLLRDGYTDGCKNEPRMFCPNEDLLLGELAVFHLKGLFNVPGSGDVGWEPPSEFEGSPWGNYYQAEWAVNWGEYLIRNGHYNLGFGKFEAAQPANLEEISMALYEIAHK